MERVSVAILFLVFGSSSFTCAPVKRGDFLRSVPVIEHIESDPNASRRAAGALTALRSCQTEAQTLQNDIQTLRKALDECQASRIESERTAGKWDGLRSGLWALMGAIGAALLAATAWRLRRFFGIPL